MDLDVGGSPPCHYRHPSKQWQSCWPCKGLSVREKQLGDCEEDKAEKKGEWESPGHQHSDRLTLPSVMACGSHHLWGHELLATCQGCQEALPFELVEDECSHCKEPNDKEDHHSPVATTATWPLRTYKNNNKRRSCGLVIPSPGLNEPTSCCPGGLVHVAEWT